MNYHAPGPRGLPPGSCGLKPARNCRHEVPQDANPGTRPPAPPPLGRRPRANGEPTTPEDFSSRNPPRGGGPLRVTPPKRGLSGARTAGPHAAHGWHAMDALVTRTHSPQEMEILIVQYCNIGLQHEITWSQYTNTIEQFIRVPE